ncbi:D-alanyl-D-alanine carboxypeptidase family protein [Undibacterium sp. SXout11W]|uniref:D-alanyl-D-alanine carboxypeptidase family protein n=1 Tax=Undibacterium sp. SXout11W TaxID=3413050 RepID=UPI003BF40941
MMLRKKLNANVQDHFYKKIAGKFLVFVVSFYPLSSWATDTDLICFPLYKAAGAVPLTRECRGMAVMARVGMGNSYCTADSDIIDRYCGNVCPIDPLKPITDPEAIRMENGENVILDKLSAQTQTALNCLKEEVAKAKGSVSVTSAYRPQAYQDHLYEIFVKRGILDSGFKNFAQCKDLYKNIQTESKKHMLKDRVGETSRHSSGRAFDANWSGVSDTDIDAGAKKCALSRPFPVDDPVHFQK